MNELPNENVINVVSLLIFEKYLKVFHFRLSLYFLRDVTNQRLELSFFVRFSYFVTRTYIYFKLSSFFKSIFSFAKRREIYKFNTHTRGMVEREKAFPKLEAK